MELNDELKDLEKRIYSSGGDAKENTYDTDTSPSELDSEYSGYSEYDDADTADMADMTDEDDTQSAYSPQFSEITDDQPSRYTDDTDESRSSKKKKKGPLQKTIIIAACILLAAVLAYFVFYAFFAHSIVGNWNYKGSDGFDYHYQFDKNGTVTMSLGTIEFTGQYNTAKTTEGMNVTVNLYYGEIGGEMPYTVTGSKILNNQVLTLSAQDSEKKLTQSSKVNFKELLKVPEDHKVDKNIIGEWEYTFEDYGVNYKFIFKEDGTMQINQYDSIIYNCVYSAENNNITCTFLTTEETTQEIEYSCDGTTLDIMGLKCTRVGAATQDQAK